MKGINVGIVIHWDIGSRVKVTVICWSEITPTVILVQVSPWGLIRYISLASKVVVYWDLRRGTPLVLRLNSPLVLRWLIPWLGLSPVWLRLHCRHRLWHLISPYILAGGGA